MSKNKKKTHKGRVVKPLRKYDPGHRAKRVSAYIVKTLVSREGPGNIDLVLKYAQKLASDSRELDTNVVKVLWFPDPYEIHIIVIETDAVPWTEEVEPFYFDASTEVPVTSGLAVIPPEQEGQLRLPEDWGDWKDRQELEIGTQT